MSTKFYKSSSAADLNNLDQVIAGTDWVEVPINRILWDLNSDIDADNNDFVVPIKGIYNFDIQIKVKTMVNVTAVELALFKRGTPDDYWFILDRNFIPAGDTETHLHCATQFDMNLNERFCIKMRLEGNTPSAVMEGNDDYTAWGYSLTDTL